MRAATAATAFAAMVLALSNSPTIAQGEIETLPVQGQVHLIAGGGGNVAAFIGPEGIMLVDSGRTDASDGVLAAVRRLSPLPIHYIVNTSADSDHVGGNAKLAAAGRPAPGSNQAAYAEAPIYAHEKTYNRISSPKAPEQPLPLAFWPTVTFFTAKRTLYFNDEPIELLWQPAAHSDGDLLVFFRRSDVVVAGEVFNVDTFPVIDVARGGSIQGEIDALNRIIDITVPRLNQMDGTRVIPGHGRICNEAEVVEYRDMVTIVRDRVRALRDKGQTLEQTQAARPAYEYEPLYGSDRGPWTTHMFVEAIYRSLPQAATPRPNRR